MSFLLDPGDKQPSSFYIYLSPGNTGFPLFLLKKRKR